MSRSGVGLLVCALLVLAPAPGSGQWWAAVSPDAADLAAAWGDVDRERSLDLGAAYILWNLRLGLGVGIVERGLDDGLEWNEDRTKIFHTATGKQVNPVEGRTTPDVSLWARVEYQPDWWGVVLMWDPRDEPAGGGFAAVTIAPDVEGQGEMRWVKTYGWLLAARLRLGVPWS